MIKDSKKKKVYIETYGCQMNVADTEIVSRILCDDGFEFTEDIHNANVILVNTCSIRENAEQRVYGRLGEFKRLKEHQPDLLIGVLGCMAERLRTKLTGERAKGVGQTVDIIVGPDEYRKMPALLSKAWHGERGIAVQLSRVETYDDIVPLRTDGISAWISVMRGCDKFCTFCVVPFTRGRERSRSLISIVKEVEELSARSFKDVTLLGQNVNSYYDNGYDFADLLKAVAEVDSTIRVRFITSHPKDMSDKLIQTISSHRNICKYIHLPIQSGSDRILSLMNRTYDTTHYVALVEKIRDRIPHVSLTTDIITGFPTETDEDHHRTLDIMESLRYDGAYTFKYSPRENTPAFKMADDVNAETKSERVSEIIALQKEISNDKNQQDVGNIMEVLVEGVSKKNETDWYGRTDGNKVVIFPKQNINVGEYLQIKINRANSATLFGSVHDEKAYQTRSTECMIGVTA